MRFVADESVDRQIVDRLRDGGHSVVSIAESEPSVSDEIVSDRLRVSTRWSPDGLAPHCVHCKMTIRPECVPAQTDEIDVIVCATHRRSQFSLIFC